MKNIFSILLAVTVTVSCAQEKASFVDYDAYENLVKEVKEHRKTRLLSVDSFMLQGKQPNVVILDTRSDSMYKAMHIKGAIHLNFSDFTQENLARIIPSKDTKILIYCNNNFLDEPDFFPTKGSFEPDEKKSDGSSGRDDSGKKFSITLALNIPTYINLYGYGYKNVFELGDLVKVNYVTRRLYFEGAAVK